MTKETAFKLMLFDFSSRKWTEVFGSQMTYPSWSHDGKYIYFQNWHDPVKHIGERIVRLRLSDRKAENIVDIKDVGRLDHRNDRGLVWTCARRLSFVRPRYQHFGNLCARCRMAVGFPPPETDIPIPERARTKPSNTAFRKTDSQSVGFSLNGTHLGLAKLHVTHSKDEKRP